MVKRSPFPVYFALIPLVVIQMQGLVEGRGAGMRAAHQYTGILAVD